MQLEYDIANKQTVNEQACTLKVSYHEDVDMVIYVVPKQFVSNKHTRATNKKLEQMVIWKLMMIRRH